MAGKTLYVYSTLAASVRYLNHTVDGANDLPQPAGDGVLIKGGAGVADKHFETPRGVVTRIDEEQAAYLKQNPTFLLHEKNGYVVIDDKDVDIEKAVGEMEGRDVSAPTVPEDYEKPPVEPDVKPTASRAKAK